MNNIILRPGATASPGGTAGLSSSVAHTGGQATRATPASGYRYVRKQWRICFTVIDWLGWLVFGALRKLTGRTAPPSAVDPRRILVVQLDHLGDAILTTGMIRALRRRWPETRIEVLASQSNRAIFAGMAEVDRVHVSRINRFARGWRCRLGWVFATLASGLRLRRPRFDVAIDVRGDFPVAVLMWLSGAPIRLGWSSGGGGFLLTHHPAYVPGRPEAESRQALLAELGIPADEPAFSCRPRFTPRTADRAHVRQALTACAELSPSEGPLVVVHVGAGTPAKQWPAEHWRQTVRGLLDRHRARVVLVGSENETATSRAIAGANPWPGVADWTGRLALGELAALLAEADLVIGVDSGPAHLAAAVDAPVVVLFSGTNDRRQWAPCGRRVSLVRHAVACGPCHRQRCPLASQPCMRKLLPATVLEAASSWLTPAADIVSAVLQGMNR